MKIRLETLSLNVLESGAGEPTLLFLHYLGWFRAHLEPRYRTTSLNVSLHCVRSTRLG